jgi:membrane associated rhomboid family serine protease
MFPLKDENPTNITPVVTVAIIVANVAVWLFVQNAGVGVRFLESLCVYGAIPGEISRAIEAGTLVPLGQTAQCRVGGISTGSLLTSMFLHGGWMHMIGNMWFLWVFGNNIEDSMGHVRFAMFYLITGLVAAGSHVLTAMDSSVPMVGASGAISGVMGAYIVLYPHVRVHTLIIFFFFIRVITLPAFALLGLWFALQLFSGTLAGRGTGGGVAFWAHVGGFVAGMALIFPFRDRKLLARHPYHGLRQGASGRAFDRRRGG